MIPARGRFDVTRLALGQQRSLADNLASRGITIDCLIVANDENLEVAEEFGFCGLERRNEPLGWKINEGFEQVCRDGADYAAFIGSDDWLHPDFFAALDPDGATVLSGHEITVVDLVRQRLRHLGWRRPHGVPPWLLPRRVLKAVHWRPCVDHLDRGMEGGLRTRLQPLDVRWQLHDPHPMTRVDFKSHVGMTAYDAVAASLGIGEELDPWPELERFYPERLVNLARFTSYLLTAEQVAA